MPLEEIISQIQSLKKFDIARETANIINENGDYISGLLKEQLSQGLDGDGNPVTVFGRSFYSDRTVFHKETSGVGLGKVTDRITNYFSGAFYQSIYVYAAGEEFILDSDVSYFPEIILQSGTKIMELNAKNLRDFSENILMPQLQLAWEKAFANV